MSRRTRADQSDAEKRRYGNRGLAMAFAAHGELSRDTFSPAEKTQAMWDLFQQLLVHAEDLGVIKVPEHQSEHIANPEELLFSAALAGNGWGKPAAHEVTLEVLKAGGAIPDKRESDTDWQRRLLERLYAIAVLIEDLHLPPAERQWPPFDYEAILCVALVCRGTMLGIDEYRKTNRPKPPVVDAIDRREVVRMALNYATRPVNSARQVKMSEAARHLAGTKVFGSVKAGTLVNILSAELGKDGWDAMTSSVQAK